jgi:hypothetical protein
VVRSPCLAGTRVVRDELFQILYAHLSVILLSEELLLSLLDIGNKFKFDAQCGTGCSSVPHAARS